MVKENGEYRSAFFSASPIQRRKHQLAKELCIDYSKDCPEYLSDWSRRGLIEQDEEGEWQPTDRWKSSLYNPVMSKIYM